MDMLANRFREWTDPGEGMFPESTLSKHYYCHVTMTESRPATAILQVSCDTLSATIRSLRLEYERSNVAGSVMRLAPQGCILIPKSEF
jgi:hypothetical protein